MKKAAVVAHVAVPLLGMSTGLRTFTALAATAWFARNRELRVRRTWASWLAHPASVTALTLLAAGEYVGDKLPNTPNRTEPMGVLGRTAVGATVGAVMATAAKRPAARGAALGVAGALLGTYGGYLARRALTRNAGLPDLPVALCEDAVAIALAVGSLKRLTE